MEEEKLVMFSWNNYFMRTIQQGIQAGHCWVNMAASYSEAGLVDCSQDHFEKILMFWKWARGYKTVNVRNGGDVLTITEIVETLLDFEDAGKLNYPFDTFYEDETQGKQLTSVSIVIPEHVYAWKPQNEYGVALRNSPLGGVTNITNALDEADQYLYNLIKSTKLAD